MNHELYYKIKLYHALWGAEFMCPVGVGVSMDFFVDIRFTGVGGYTDKYMEHYHYFNATRLEEFKSVVKRHAKNF